MPVETDVIQRLKRANRQLTALRMLLDREDIESMPEWVQLLTTDFCNLRCPHCNTHGSEEKRAVFNNSPNMEADFFAEVSEQALPYADEVTLTLTGEPLATPQLEKAMEIIRPYEARLNLVTNGTTLNARRLSLLLPVAGFIKVSIDGATPLMLESLRLGSKWKDLLTKIRGLMLAVDALPDTYVRPTVIFGVVAMASNLRDLPHIVRLAACVGVRKVGIAPIVVTIPGQADEPIHKHRAY